MEMSLAEAAWLAGLFEGEGSVINYQYVRGHNVGQYQRRLTIVSTDRDVLAQATRFAGVGSILGPTQRKATWKPIYAWNVSRWPEIAMVATAMRPWLGARRGAAIDALLANPPARVGGGRPWQTLCKRNHPLEGPGADVYLTKAGARVCRACVRERRGVDHDAARGPRQRADELVQAERAAKIDERKRIAAEKFVA